MTQFDQPSAQPGWYPEPTTGRIRWWDGQAWGPYQQPAQPPQPAQPQPQPQPTQPAQFAPPPLPQPMSSPSPMPMAVPMPMQQAYVVPVRTVGNGFAIAALILGIWGFITTWLPFFIGLIVGLVPDILAIVFGILGIVRAGKIGGRGLPLAIIGLALGSLAFISVFFGAGTIW